MQHQGKMTWSSVVRLREMPTQLQCRRRRVSRTICAKFPLGRLSFLHRECRRKSQLFNDRLGDLIKPQVIMAAAVDVFSLILTVCPGITSVVADTYGCGDGRIVPTRCALIAGRPGDRWSQCRVCNRPPAGVGSARSGLAAASKQASTTAPGAFHRSRTTPPSRTTPCGDASLARCAPGTHPARPRPCPV